MLSFQSMHKQMSKTWLLTICLSHLTQSPIMHQDSKNIHAAAYLWFFLFHFIIVPIVSLLFQLMQFFSTDYAITEVANFKLTYSPTDCKVFIKQCLKKGYGWNKNNYIFHSLWYIIVDRLLISKGQNRALWWGKEGAATLGSHRVPTWEWFHLSERHFM